MTPRQGAAPSLCKRPFCERLCGPASAPGAPADTRCPLPSDPGQGFEPWLLRVGLSAGVGYVQDHIRPQGAAHGQGGLQEVSWLALALSQIGWATQWEGEI
jgi:hypothetical protein